jgi:hypothetical protein
MSGRNLINMDTSTTNVYLNRDPIEATLPVQAIQTTVNDPITISLKGLTGIGASNANKVIKVNSAGDALEYANDEIGSEWTLSGSNLYPLATSTNVLIGTTSNTNGHGLFLLDKELAIKTAGGSTYYGLKIIYDTYTVNNYVSNLGNMLWEGAQFNYNFDKPLVIDTQGNGSELSNGTYSYTLPADYGGTLALTTDIISSEWSLNSNNLYPLSTSTNILIGTTTNSDSRKLLVDGTAEIKGQFTINTTGAELSNGTYTYTLPSSSGTLALTTQINLTTASNFGTATTTNPVKVGNIAGQSIGLELHFNVLKLINTSGVQIATFTPVSNTCDLDLNGGLLKTFTASTNATWQGTAIAYNYGGTGLSSLSGQANKVLQVNSGENGYTFATLPSTSKWTLSGTNLYPIATTTNVTIGTTANPYTRKLLVNGDTEITGKLLLSSTSIAEIQIDNTSGKGIHFNSDTNEGFKLFADSSINGTPVINVLHNTAPILQLESIDTTYHKFSVGLTETYSNNSNLTRNYFVKSSNNNIGTYIENNFTDNTFNLRTFTLMYDEAFMSINLSNNNQRTTTFEKCSQFTISSGAGANGDCSLVIRADTDDAIETANPIIRLQQDGAAVESKIEMTDGNNLRIGNEYSSGNVSIFTNSGTFQITNSLTNDNNMANITNLLAEFKSTQTKVEELLTTKIIATNNTSYKISSSSYGWQFRGTLGKQISIADIVNAPYIGCDSTNNYLINIANIGDAYTIVATSTSDMAHTFTGKVKVNTIEGDNNTENTIVSTTTDMKIKGEVGFMNIGKATNNSHIKIDANGDDAYIYLNQLHNYAYWDCAVGKSNQTVGWYFRNASRSYTSGFLAVSSTGALSTSFAYTSSDDRLKINEELIEDATTTIMKLRPQKYDKYTYLESEINNFEGEQKPLINELTHEFGFIAQEIYYEIPELRKLVSVPASAVLIDDNENMNFEDIQNDPDYSNWGTEKALVHYNSFIPLLTKGFQEQQEQINTQQEQINTQQEEINTLKTELDTYKSLMDKLINAKSFSEFKKNIA